MIIFDRMLAFVVQYHTYFLRDTMLDVVILWGKRYTGSHLDRHEIKVKKVRKFLSSFPSHFIYTRNLYFSLTRKEYSILVMCGDKKKPWSVAVAGPYTANKIRKVKSLNRE